MLGGFPSKCGVAANLPRGFGVKMDSCLENFGPYGSRSTLLDPARKQNALIWSGSIRSPK